MSPHAAAYPVHDLPGFEYDLARFIPFRDLEACRRLGEMPRTEITDHPNPDFKVRVIQDRLAFYQAFADDLVGRIRAARDEGRAFAAILPVGPMPQYELAVQAINSERLSLAHVCAHSTWTSRPMTTG